MMWHIPSGLHLMALIIHYIRPTFLINSLTSGLECVPLLCGAHIHIFYTTGILANKYLGNARLIPKDITPAWSFAYSEFKRKASILADSIIPKLGKIIFLFLILRDTSFLLCRESLWIQNLPITVLIPYQK